MNTAAFSTTEKFLWGALGPEEQSAFLNLLDKSPPLLRECEREAAYESLFYSMSWNIQTMPDQENETDRALLDAPLPSIENINDADLAAAMEWDALLENAFARAPFLPKADKKPVRTIPFPKAAWYLAAACLAGAIAGVSLLWPPRQNADAPTALLTIAPDATTSAVGEKRDTVGHAVSPTSYSFDSIVIYSPRPLAGKPIATETHDGIVRIGDNTAILLDKNSSVAVTSQSDSAVALSLDRGGALFTVEKHRFNRFSVATPAGDIAVTGTIFRLAIENSETIVSVLEGSVKASKRNDTAAIAIYAGMSARLRPDTIMIETGDTAATLLYRSGILRDFLHENGVFQDGMFVRSGISGRRDMIKKDTVGEHTIRNNMIDH